MTERRISFYECLDGYIIHDADKHKIYTYKKDEIEEIKSYKTIREVLEGL